MSSIGRKWLSPNRFHTANNDSTSRKIQPGGEVFGLLPDATKLVRTKTARLERLSRAHQNSLKSLSWTADNTGRILDRAAADEPLLIAGISRTTPTRGDSFRMTLGRMTATDRVDAGQWLNQYLTGRFPRYGDRGEQDLGIIARVGGHAITARTTPAMINEPSIQLALDGVPRTGWSITMRDAASGLGLIRQIENHITALPTVLCQLRADRDRAQQEGDAAQAQLDRPFKHIQALAEARAQQAQVHASMAARQQAQPRVMEVREAVDPEITEAITCTKPHSPTAPPARPRLPRQPLSTSAEF